MAVEISDVFKKLYPETDIRITPPEERKKILEELDEDLQLAHEECLRTLKVA